MHSANISKRGKKRRARENPNRFNFRYGDNAKWLQCKEGRLRGENLLPQGGMKLPAALRLLFMIYRVLVTWGGMSHGDPSQAQVSGAPTTGWRAVGAVGMQDRTGDEAMWLHQILPSFRKCIL